MANLKNCKAYNETGIGQKMLEELNIMCNFPKAFNNGYEHI